MHDTSISLKHSTQSEQQAKERLEGLLGRYDLSAYYFTKTIQFESGVTPHSHPVLTLNTFPYTDENIMLDTFLHEQLHWYFYAVESRPRVASWSSRLHALVSFTAAKCCPHNCHDVQEIAHQPALARVWHRAQVCGDVIASGREYLGDCDLDACAYTAAPFDLSPRWLTNGILDCGDRRRSADIRRLLPIDLANGCGYVVCRADN